MADKGLISGSTPVSRAAEERRVVTILFADVTGSTALAEHSDPEDVRALLGRYYEIARRVIGEHGGTVEKFIGDAVMAVFGVPQAHGDDAERALVAALALREAAARDSQTAALTLRMGVNTGEVVASRASAARDFLVTGDAVNVAARLQQNADPGSILVGERTIRAVSRFRFGQRERIAVKGKQEPIVGAVLLERSADQRASAPFVGREHDLAQLQLVAERAFKERRPQLVMITAAAGTGKSRLVEEFGTRIGRAATIATAQCLPYGAAVTFLPLRGLARGLVPSARDEDLVPAIRKIFETAGYGEADARRLSSFIGKTLGDGDDSERVDREEIFSAWRLLIEVLAAREPLLVVFEDLHWASDTLLDLVEHVTVSRTSAPLVMVALARQELLDRRPNWGGGRRNFTSLALEPLTRDDTLRLVGVAARVPAALAARIAERAGGNPFFAGELIRAYEEKRDAGETDEDILLPDTVHATVLARIDTLTPAERAVLEFAAVAGRSVRVPLLRQLLPDISETQLVSALGALIDRDFISPHGSDSFMFRHIVIREVAYATLPRAERVQAHLRLAQWFEDAQSTEREVAELVAYQYRQAISLSPGGRLPEGMDAGVVVKALERAARIASAGAAYGEARQLLRDAIRLAPQEQHQRLHELLGDLLQFGDEAMGAYREAFRQWRDAGSADGNVGARLLIKQLTIAGRWRGSLTSPMDDADLNALVNGARELLDRSPDAVLESKLACAKAFGMASDFRPLPDNDYAALLSSAEAARQIYAQRGDAEAESEALDAIAAVHRRVGNFAASIAAQRERIANAERLGLLERVDAWGTGAWDLVFLGQFKEAIQMFEEGRRALRTGDPEHMLIHAASWATYAAMLSGDWNKALQLGDLLLEMREQMPSTASARFTFPGWIGALRVATARMDSTRAARYRSVFVSVAAIHQLSGPTRMTWQALIDGDATMARGALAQPTGSRDRKSELLAMLIFDLGERISEQELVALERQAVSDPAMLSLRVSLARALNKDSLAVRDAVNAFDRGGMAADAARASVLLALGTHDASARDTAERRVRALGDLVYAQKLAEEW